MALAGMVCQHRTWGVSILTDTIPFWTRVSAQIFATLVIRYGLYLEMRQLAKAESTAGRENPG